MSPTISDIGRPRLAWRTNGMRALGVFPGAASGARLPQAVPQPGTPMSHPLILPMAAHVALAAFLYVLLTAARAPAVWGIGRRADGSDPWAGIEPRIAANLSNQFEWPLFFHVGCLLLLLSQPQASRLALALAWLFVAGRVLHSLVQILTANVRLRGVVFTINFVAVLGLWAVAVLSLPRHR